jgi:hypothetical protein
MVATQVTRTARSTTKPARLRSGFSLIYVPHLRPKSECPRSESDSTRPTHPRRTNELVLEEVVAGEENVYVFIQIGGFTVETTRLAIADRCFQRWCRGVKTEFTLSLEERLQLRPVVRDGGEIWGALACVNVRPKHGLVDTTKLDKAKSLHRHDGFFPAVNGGLVCTSKVGRKSFCDDGVIHIILGDYCFRQSDEVVEGVALSIYIMRRLITKEAMTEMATNAKRICCNRIRRFCLLLIFGVFFFLLAIARLSRHDTMASQ